MVATARECALAAGGAYHAVEPAETIDVPPSFQPVGPRNWAFADTARLTSEAQGVVEVPGARFWGWYGGLVFGPGGELLLDVSRDIWPAWAHTARVRFRFPSTVALPGVTVSLAHPEADGNFFHWTLEVLPRVHLLRRAGWVPERVDRYLVNADLNGYRTRTLAEFGIPPEKLVRVDGGFHAQCARLVVPEMRACAFTVPVWAAHAVRGTLGVETVERVPRLFVNREDAAFRRLRNAAELLPVFERRGYTCLDIGTLPLERQRGVFAAADLVVAVHGSGLTNLCWARPGTRVGEIFPPNYMDQAFRNLAAVRGLPHAVLTGEGALPPPGRNPRARFDDVRVEPRRLDAWLEALEREPGSGPFKPGAGPAG